jgi:hypothetical protein
MRFWMTTHWPPRERESAAAGDSGVWVPDGREAAGANISPDDKVVVYESRSGPPIIQHHPDGSTTRIKCQIGHEGIIHYGTITERLSALGESQPEEYANGRTLWWRWFASVKVHSRSGFVSRPDLLAILGYKSTYNLHGFGSHHSGLREITGKQYTDIVEKFHSTRPLQLPKYPIPRAGSPTGGGEGPVHKALKEYVAADPSAALGEPGLRTIQMEYPFPTGDRADIVLADQYERVVAVEIEPAVTDSEIVGPLQSIKYRYMLELVCDRASGDSRALLVAHSISEKMQERCRRYGVQCIEVPKSAVTQKKAAGTHL